MKCIYFKYIACWVLTNMCIVVTTIKIKLQNIFITSESSLLSLCNYHPTSAGNYRSVFSHHRLVLPALESHMNGIILYTSFLICLISLSVMFLKFIYIVTCINISFWFIADTIPLSGLTIICLPIYPLIDIWVFLIWLL